MSAIRCLRTWLAARIAARLQRWPEQPSRSRSWWQRRSLRRSIAEPSRSFWSLRPLRWTAAAATAAVVLSAVWLNRKEVTRQELPAGTETNPAIVQTQNEQTPVPGPQGKSEATVVSSAPATDKESAPQASALRADNASKPDALAKTKAASPKERAELASGSVNGAAVDEFAAEKKQSLTGNVTDQKDAPMLRARELGQLQAAKVPSNQPVGGPLFNVSAGAAAKTERALPSAHSVSSNDVALAPAKSAPQAPHQSP